jgi:hypothetical protein
VSLELLTPAERLASVEQWPSQVFAAATAFANVL